MEDEERHPGFDPYRAVEQSLKSGDGINRWILSHPRRQIVHLLKGQRVLDVCCGTGNLTAMLAAAGCQAVGVDRSPTMLSQAQRKGIAAEFKQMDATQLPFHHEFDAAVISIALHEMNAQVRDLVWESMRGAVRPGGRLIALDFAVPQHNSLLARLFGWLIEQDERGTLSYDPGHYQNFKDFMRKGGLLAWIQKRSQSIEADYRFWGGTVAVVVAG